MVRSSTAVAGNRMAYAPPPLERVVEARMAKAASARTTTVCPRARYRSMTGRRSSSYPSALWTLPGRSLAATQSPSWLMTKNAW